MQTTKGSLFLIIGPSGVGKTTLAKALIASPKCSHLKLVPSYTTRSPRPEEKPGVDYHFISQADFDKKLAAGFFIESSNAYKNSYGSSRNDLLEPLQEGYDVLAVVDRVGARAIVKQLPEAIVINIVPPTMEILRERLLKRSKNMSHDIEFRLQKAQEELAEEKQEHLAQYTVVNNDLEGALRELQLLMCTQKK